MPRLHRLENFFCIGVPILTPSNYGLQSLAVEF
jgi:hypothetical protein